MSLTPRKTVVRRFYDDMWNKADKSLIAEIFHADFTFRGSLGPVLIGHEQFAGYVDTVVRALPDFRCEIVDMVEEEHKVVARMLFHGSHRGEFFGFAPTGEEVTWQGSAHFTFAGEQVADLWVLGDVHGLLQQLKANRSSERSND